MMIMMMMVVLMISLIVVLNLKMTRISGICAHSYQGSRYSEIKWCGYLTVTVAFYKHKPIIKA